MDIRIHAFVGIRNHTYMDIRIRAFVGIRNHAYSFGRVLASTSHKLEQDYCYLRVLKVAERKLLSAKASNHKSQINRERQLID